MNLLVRKLIFILIFLSSCSAIAATECEQNLMDSYLAHRSALLDADFNVKEVLKTLRPNISESIKKNSINAYIVALRIQEAKILAVSEYAATCDDDESTLKIKILFLEGGYDRLKVTFKKYGDKQLIYGSTLESSNSDFDKGQKYEPVVLIYPKPVVLKRTTK